MKVALIHTVQSVLESFGDKIKSVIDDVEITNILDEYLATDPAKRGEFTVNNKNRLFKIIECAEMTEPDAIVVSCSTVSPAVELIKPFISVPLITIDEAMIKKAVEIGTNIAVMATAKSTIKPTTHCLRREADKINKKIQLSVTCCPDAFEAMESGDMKKHNEILIKKASDMKKHDVIVLAQASMAGAERDMMEATNTPVVSSPRFCIEQLKEILNKSQS